MAGFTSMALLGAGLVGGTLLGRKAKKNDQNQTQVLAPGATDAATTVSPITPPAPPIVDPGAQQATANQAGAKVRKRAAVGSLLTTPKAPKSSTMPIGPRYASKSLLGS